MNIEQMTGVAVHAALRAGEVLRRGFGTPYQISVKSGVHNLVTQFDKEAEDAIIETIKESFPSHTFLAEESGGETETSSVLWIIDPLDGTFNFVHHIPIFSVSIGAYAENEMQLGVIYLPLTHELYIAEKGKGAYLNGSRIRVSQIKQMKNAIAVTGLPSQESTENDIFDNFQPLRYLLQEGTPIRDLGSAAIHLAYLAAGRVDAFWIPRLQPWDLAAGKLLVEEAGGKVTGYDGAAHPIFPEGPLLATNGFLHEEFANCLEPEMW